MGKNMPMHGPLYKDQLQGDPANFDFVGDTYVDVSPFDFVKIFIIYLLFIILPRICSQDISRLNKAIVMKLSMMIDLSLT